MCVDMEKSSCCRVLHCIDDISSPSLFVLYLLSNALVNVALKLPSGKVSYGTTVENLCRIPCVFYDNKLHSKSFVFLSPVPSLYHIAYFLFVVSVGLGENNNTLIKYSAL